MGQLTGGPFAIKGVGDFKLFSVDANGNKILKAGAPLAFSGVSSMKLGAKVDMDLLYAADHPVAIEQYVKSKEFQVDLVTEFLDLRVLAAHQGSNLATSASAQTVWAMDEPLAIPGASTYTATLANAATAITSSVTVEYQDGTPFAQVVSAPAAGQFSVTTGVLTFAAADANTKVYASYQYTRVADVLTIGNTDIPLSLQFVWQQKSFRMKDGLFHTLQVDLPVCTPFGNFDFDAKHAATAKFPLSLRVIDGLRADNAIGWLNHWTTTS